MPGSDASEDAPSLATLREPARIRGGGNRQTDSVQMLRP